MNRENFIRALNYATILHFAKYSKRRMREVSNLFELQRTTASISLRLIQLKSSALPKKKSYRHITISIKILESLKKNIGLSLLKTRHIQNYYTKQMNLPYSFFVEGTSIFLIDKEQLQLVVGRHQSLGADGPENLLSYYRLKVMWQFLVWQKVTREGVLNILNCVL